MMLHQILWNANLGIAAKCLDHPFVQGIQKGTLDEKAFRIYIAQDVFFLNAFRKAYLAAALKAKSKKHSEIFKGLAKGVDNELKLHSSYSKKLKINLKNVKPLTACKKYTSFLLKTAAEKNAGEIIAAMAPCVVLYVFLGEELAKKQKKKHKYSDWIETYSGQEMKGLRKKIELLLDKLATDIPNIRKVYNYAMKCELEFFDEPIRSYK